MIDEVCAHIADGADAPIGPAAPVEGMVDGVIADLGSDAKKKIPVEALGHRIVSGEGGGEARVHAGAVPAERVGGNFQRLGTRDALRPEAERTVGPDVDFADFADGAGPDVFDGGAGFVEGVALVAHLRGDFGFFGAAGEVAGFFDTPGERLLHVDVLAEIHGGGGDGGVHVVGSGDDDGVDVFLVLEHVAVIFVALGFRQLGF